MSDGNPARYIKLARLVMDVIELDPFSDAAANEVVQARRFFSVAESAYDHEWSCKSLFMNPPYSGRGESQKAIARFLEQLDQHGFEAIVLANNATETRWFQALLGSANAVCLTNHKIRFWAADGKQVSSPTRGQVFFYFGDAMGKIRFQIVFQDIGAVLQVR